MPFGPDQKNELNFLTATPVEVFPGGKISAKFYFQAVWENAIVIYQAGDLKEIAVRGNYSRTSDAWEEVNSTNQTIVYLITGWHKNNPPDDSTPWIQSEGGLILENSSVSIIGFEDNTDADQSDFDFNDAVAVIQISF